MTTSAWGKCGWLNLVLVGVIAGLGALAWFEPGRKDEKGEHQPFAALTDATAFSIEGGRHGRVEFVKDGGAWSLAATRVPSTSLSPLTK